MRLSFRNDRSNECSTWECTVTSLIRRLSLIIDVMRFLFERLYLTIPGTLSSNNLARWRRTRLKFRLAKYTAISGRGGLFRAETRLLWSRSGKSKFSQFWRSLGRQTEDSSRRYWLRALHIVFLQSGFYFVNGSSSTDDSCLVTYTLRELVAAVGKSFTITMVTSFHWNFIYYTETSDHSSSVDGITIKLYMEVWRRENCLNWLHYDTVIFVRCFRHRYKCDIILFITRYWNLFCAGNLFRRCNLILSFIVNIMIMSLIFKFFIIIFIVQNLSVQVQVM